MRIFTTTLIAVVVLAVCRTAAVAADFVCTPSRAGDQWTYTLRSNHATYDIVEWRLCWSENDTVSIALASANFVRSQASYISLPAAWDRSEDVTEPRMWTQDAVYGGQPIAHGGGQKSFTIVYKTTSSTPASLFRVGCTDSANGNAWVGWIGGAMSLVPEPTGIVILLGGLASSGLLMRRRRA